MRSEDIGNRKWSKGELQAIQRISIRQAKDQACENGLTQIPALTEVELASMVRLRDVQSKVAVSVRLDPRVLAWLKSKGQGHLTRINDILLNLMEAEKRMQPGR